MFPYLPQTEGDIKEMLKVIGVQNVDDLFSDIPDDLFRKELLSLPKGKSEYDVYREMENLSKRNQRGISFLGCGSYDHLIPSVVKHVLRQPNFYTAYTPYQGEISQGVLQSIFEFQTDICELTGLDVSNASLYDGHTAASEAITMALNTRKKADTILVSETVHPNTLKVVKTFFSDVDVIFKTIKADNYRTSFENMKAQLNDSVAAVLVQTPNFFGWVEDFTGFAEAVHENKSLFIISSNPMSLGVLKSQAEWGADIAIGDTQVFGLDKYFGGPSVGYMAATSKLMRKMPGRIVGQTVDRDGDRAFVLTLQAREQHIKRERATSNICSNQALAALANAVYMSTVGWTGLREAASQSARKAHYLYKRLTGELGLQPLAENDFLYEFTLTIPESKKVLASLQREGIFGGVALEQFYPDLKDAVTIAVTEKRSKDEIDLFVDLLKRVVR